MEPYSRTAIPLFFVCSTFVIAAVNVVLPWSMCPIVPMFTCGFVRSYFAFAMARTSRTYSRRRSSVQNWSPCPGLNRRPRPYQGRALPTELHGQVEPWSGKRDSNPRPPAWKAGALPLSYSRPSLMFSLAVPPTLLRGSGRSLLRVASPSKWWGGEDSNLRRRSPADLQSAPFGHLGTSPKLPACDGIPRPRVTRTLALAGGFEPPTHCLQGSCST